MADVADSTAAAWRRLSKELRGVPDPVIGEFPDLGSLGEMEGLLTWPSDPGGVDSEVSRSSLPVSFPGQVFGSV